MEDPKDPSDKNTSTITADLTATSGDENYAAADALRAQHLKTLLGSRPLKSVASNQEYLLMIHVSDKATRLLEEIQKEQGHPQIKVPSEEVYCVIGPFPEKRLQDWTEAGLIFSSYRVMKPFDRWKDIGSEFPTWIFASETERISSEEEGDFSEEDRESTVPAVEISDQPVTLSRQQAGAKRPVAAERANRRSPQQNTNFLIPAAIGGIFLVGIMIYFLTQNRSEPADLVAEIPVASVNPAEAFKGRVPESEWPIELRPLKMSDLFKNESAAMKRIRPILMGFENGKLYLEQSDQLDLRRASDPASASFEARKAATNLLAYYSWRLEDLASAIRLLETVNSQDSTDAVTQINLGIFYLMDKKYAQATESFLYVSRIKNYAGLMKALMGLAQAKRGLATESKQSFNEAFDSRPLHPSIYGLWLNATYTPDSGRSIVGTVVMDILNRSLWSDHDLHRDSSLPAPVFVPILRGWVNDGLEVASKNIGLHISKRKFMEWMRNRDRVELGSSLQGDELRELFLKEDDIQSKVLLAYVLKEGGKFDAAAQILSSTLPHITERHTKSSWPWCLAGELQLHLGYYAEAEAHFETALSKNRDDVGALNGLAVLARATGNYSVAERRFTEARNLDPFFIPAKLRISRIQWQTESGRLK